MEWPKSIRALPIVAILVASAAAALSNPAQTTAAEISRPSTVGVEPGSAAGLEPRQAAGPPPGAILLGIAKNQWSYCVLLCPPMIEFAFNVTTATLNAPEVYDRALAETGSESRARGIALTTVTGPASDGIDKMFSLDIALVVPKVKNVMGVTAVEMMTVADLALSGDTPDEVGAAYDTGRTRILEAVETPMMYNPPDLRQPDTRLQYAAVNAVDIGWTAGYVVPEMMMIGGAASVDKAADALAATGDPAQARDAGLASLNQVIHEAGLVLRDSITNRRQP
ncbi:hypothetical protein VZC37_11705 [Gordonia sp. LSe1-13]|uniref:Uncharacterized protein n=1 Tax=Gordonia sesuvii TaxID=3116777 RepID=A0ABU7MEK0_9ACTN|nr:hypothetical protein [Gordonia sp. LSe1-13]